MEDELIQLLQKSADRTAQLLVRFATVVSVDEEKLTCKVRLAGEDDLTDDELLITRLVAVDETTDSYIVKIPTVDSTVVIATVGGDLGNSVVVKTSMVDKCLIKIEDTKFTIDPENFDFEVKKISGKSDEMALKCDKIVINDGNNKGLAKVEEIAKKLNKVEQQINKVVQALQGITIAIAAGGGSFPLFTFFENIVPLVDTQASELENDKIKH